MSKNTTQLEECPVKLLIDANGNWLVCDGQADHPAEWEETFGTEPAAEIVMYHLLVTVARPAEGSEAKQPRPTLTNASGPLRLSYKLDRATS